MKFPISQRLLACADFVVPGEKVADIGCDHGYLSIYLLRNGICPSVIAADVRQQPLLSAVRNAEKYGVREKMQFYLSDGVQNVPRDFDCLICAGMGGDTIISILRSAPWLQNEQYHLVLQCQSKSPMLRQYLSQCGWRISQEHIVRDGRFLYTVMSVFWEPAHCGLTAGQWYFPPVLLENPGAEVKDYYAWVLKGVQTAVAHRPTEELQSALQELMQMEDML